MLVGGQASSSRTVWRSAVVGVVNGWAVAGALVELPALLVNLLGCQQLLDLWHKALLSLSSLVCPS